MKKVFTALAIVALLGATSCKKDYTCTCTDGDVLPIDNAKKSDAEDACDALDALNSIASGSCTLD